MPTDPVLSSSSPAPCTAMATPSSNRRRASSSARGDGSGLRQGRGERAGDPLPDPAALHRRADANPRPHEAGRHLRQHLARARAERARFEALTRGHLAAAGLDVFEEEPSPLDNPIFNLENVVVSSHVAGVPSEANRQMAVQVAGEMLRVLRGERPNVLVNPDVWPRLGQR